MKKPARQTASKKSSQRLAKKTSANKTAAPAVKKTSSKANLRRGQMAGLENIWPVERNFMERPDRWKYVRKIVQFDGCVFCSAHQATLKTQASFESLVLHKSKHAMVVMNKFPYNTGHLMIIPQEHCGDLNELSMEVHLDVQRLLKEAVRILKSVYQCAGLNAGINLGAVAGAGIPDHLHWHVIPRWHGDTNFFPLIAETKVLPETLEHTYEKLQPHFKDLE